MTTLHDRLAHAARGVSYRRIARLTGVHPETARRYMQGQSPSVEFVAGFCEQFGVSAEWLLRGIGPERADHVQVHALTAATPGGLASALGSTLDSMTARLERLERLVDTMQPHGASAHGPEMKSTAA